MPATVGATTGATTPVKSPSLSVIQADHTYWTSESPRSLKRKLNLACDNLTTMKKRLRCTQQKTRRLRTRVDSLETVVRSLQDKHLVSGNGADLLSKTFSGVPSEILKRMLNNTQRGKVTRDTYPPVLRAFALTLQFYSTKAYRYVRKSFNLALPVSFGDKSLKLKWTGVNPHLLS